MPRTRRIESTTLAVAAPGANGAKPRQTRTRVVTAATKAATLYNRLGQLDEAEAEEVAAATPQGIRAKYDARRAKACEGADADVLRLVRKMRVADEPESQADNEASAEQD